VDHNDSALDHHRDDDRQSAMNPVSLLIFALTDHVFLAAIAVIALGIVLAFAVFGGGWS
jgi:hypothetical protein